jgi:putative ABC transport system permease protein
MLRNYFRIAHRTLLKNRVFSFINIFGLAVGMAAFLFIIQYVRFERSYEQFNPNADNIYRITLDLYNGSEYVVTDCETHAAMGPLLKEKMPEVLDYARMFHNDGLQDVEVGDRKFLEEGGYFADTSAFRILSLGIVHGEKRTALSNPFQIVITESTAKKYFGRTDVIGEAIKIENRLYHVSAVIADLPPNTHLKFNFLLSHGTLENIYSWYTKYPWGGNNEYTYLLIAPGTDLAAFNKKLTALCASMKEQLEDDRYTAENMQDIHLYSNKTFEPEVNGNARVVYFLLIIAVFIIVIAWVNYVNLSTARAIERAREVGIRKVMGSLKVQLVFQFLSESIMVNLIAAVLAFGMFQMGLPFFRELTGQPLSLNIIAEPSFWSLFLMLFLIGSVLSGLYPALVLSSFQPSTVLKGKFQSSSHGQRLRKGLVVFQFAATVILMICMCTVYLQIRHMRTHDLGMNIDQTLVLRAPRLPVPDSAYQAVFESSFRSFKTELLRHPEIQLVARSESVPGLSLHELSTTSNVKRVGQEKSGGSYNYYSYSVDADFIPALNMELVAGRNFEAGTPNLNMVIINEDAVSKLGFSSVEEALGSKLTFSTRGNGDPSTVIGVLRNFYQRSPKEPHIPMIFKYRERADYLSLRLKTVQVHETLATVKTVWDQVFPGSVFHYFFMDQNYNQQYQADVRFGRVIGTFSGLAVFIACLGLFGLSSFTIVQRTKEIGIRKVLGASVGQIVRLLSQDFVKVVMIAALLALPVAYFAMEEWLSGYAVRINLSGWIFALPVVMILLIALLTVSVQTIKTALANPVDSLKQE